MTTAGRRRRTRVSVLLPVRNGEATVARAIRSVLADLDPADELIVIDDGSTDSTRAVVAGIPGAVAIVPNRGAGIVDALNTGLGEAGGEYVARCDADDAWLPGHLATLRTALDSAPGAVAAFGAARLVTPDGLVRGASIPPSADELPAALLRGNPLIHGAVLARTAAVTAVGGYQHYPGAEDYDLWIRLLAEAEIATTEELVYEYRLSDSSAHRAKRHRQARSSLRILLRHASETRRFSAYGILRTAVSAGWPAGRFWYQP